MKSEDPTAKNLLVLADLLDRQAAVIQILLDHSIQTQSLTEALIKLLIENRALTGPEQNALADRLQSFADAARDRLHRQVAQALATWAENHQAPPSPGPAPNPQK